MGEVKKQCDTCKFYMQTCPILPCGDCSERFAVPDSKWQPYTKADWIRSLSDEELASYIAGLIFAYKFTNESASIEEDYKKVLTSIQAPLEKLPLETKQYN